MCSMLYDDSVAYVYVAPYIFYTVLYIRHVLRLLCTYEPRGGSIAASKQFLLMILVYNSFLKSLLLKGSIAWHKHRVCHREIATTHKHKF